MLLKLRDRLANLVGLLCIVLTVMQALRFKYRLFIL